MSEPTALSTEALTVWAKTGYSRLESTVDRWSPLWRHLDDAARVAGFLWDHWLPRSTQDFIDAALGGSGNGRALVQWIAGIHDVGKCSPAFAIQSELLCEPMRKAGLRFNTSIVAVDRAQARHEIVGMLAVEEWLKERHSWSRSAARQFSIIIGGHHGIPPDIKQLQVARNKEHLLGDPDIDPDPWKQTRNELLDRAAAQWGMAIPSWSQVQLPQPAQALVTATVVVADWISSDETLFPLVRLSSRPEPNPAAEEERALQAWEQLNLPNPWNPTEPTETARELLQIRFNISEGARPSQIAAVKLARTMPLPGLMIVEAPMGEGKTETALMVAEILAARTGAGGTFVALPTQATTNAMFTRVHNWLRRLPNNDDAEQALFLAHGKSRLNDEYTGLLGGHPWSGSTIGEDFERSELDASQSALGPGAGHSPQRLGLNVVAHQWLEGSKRGQLASFVVGTIDQALFSTLQSRYLMLRHLALGTKVVIIDEVHAYDPYMSTYLARSLEWLGAMGAPVIMLSATLPAAQRETLYRAYARGIRGKQPQKVSPWAVAPPDCDSTPTALDTSNLHGDIGYPVITTGGGDAVPTVTTTRQAARSANVSVSRLDDDLGTLGALLQDRLADGGCAVVIRNTVGRVQEAAEYLGGLFPPGVVSVAHSQYLARDRATKDRWLVKQFGPPEEESRTTVRPQQIVVATQVVEQSLDLDFDLMVTDIAPIDLVLQRMGRMHRHRRVTADGNGRPPKVREATCFITGVDWAHEPPRPVKVIGYVYEMYHVLRSLAVLSPYLDGERQLVFPDSIPHLVQDAYGDTPQGPPSWRQEIARCHEVTIARIAERESRANAYLLSSPRNPGVPIAGWVTGGIGDADDGPRGQRQVRDGDESLEVLVVQLDADGGWCLPDWIDELAGAPISRHERPPDSVGAILASCSVRLPRRLTHGGIIDSVIDELEKNRAPGWDKDPFLAGELVLVLMSDQTTTLQERFLVYYDPDNGLQVIDNG